VLYLVIISSLHIGLFVLTAPQRLAPQDFQYHYWSHYDSEVMVRLLFSLLVYKNHNSFPRWDSDGIVDGHYDGNDHHYLTNTFRGKLHHYYRH
jgi:hypothetical protein